MAAFSVVAGSMMGIGIFLMPQLVAQHVDSTWLFLAVWLLGGLFALAGAVACGELGAMMPRAGGDYVFQREAFGQSVAFASGWVLFAAIFTGSVAAVAVGVCQYQLPVLLGVETLTDPSDPAFYLFGHGVSKAHAIAAVLVIAVTALNVAGTKLSALAQSLMTFVPIVAFSCLAVVAIVVGGDADAVARAVPPPESTNLSGLVSAYVAVYFAYSGWNNIIYVAGEVRKPGKMIPRSLIWGTVAVTTLYLLLCLTFLNVLGLDHIRGLEAMEAGSATALAVGGDTGRLVMTIVIAMALIASLNATILGGARVAYAMGRGGAFLGTFGKLGRNGVPTRALWLQAGLAICFILFETFDQIAQTVGLAMLITGFLTVASLFVLRVKKPDMPRPYRATLYPWLPALYLLSCLVVLAVKFSEAFSDKPNAWLPLLGIAILLVALVSHWIYQVHRSRIVMVGLLILSAALLLAPGLATASP